MDAHLAREDRLDIPLRARKPTVFAIWSDLFHKKVPFEFIERVWEVFAKSPQHTFLVLTKRPERLAHFIKTSVVQIYTLPNVYFGTTVENQEQADKRIPELLKVPGKKILSVEPMLGPIDFTNIGTVIEHGQYKEPEYLHGLADVHAVICGGESGAGARPTHPEWVRDLRDQCASAGVPFTFKQWGEWAPVPDLKIKLGDICMSEDGDIFTVDKNYVCAHNESEGTWMRKQKKSGHLLDGKEYINLPWRATAMSKEQRAKSKKQIKGEKCI